MLKTMSFKSASYTAHVHGRSTISKEKWNYWMPSMDCWSDWIVSCRVFCQLSSIQHNNH